MTEDNIEITRRQILGSASAIGLAGAGAGLGTSAYFSDTESFDGNTLSAGELDLKVDWEEHYSYPQLYGFDDPTENLEYSISRSEPEGEDFVGFPDPENPQVWIHEDDIPAYMANTSIEAFPDPDNDGQQETELEGFTYSPCDDGADLPEDLSNFPPEEGYEAARTQNQDTYVDDEAQPLINLQDVKPGDFGELTLSFHLCDNPGYVWLRTANVSEDGGAYTEPEQEAEGDDENSADLAENIETVWWYDSRGDNVLQTDCEETLYLTDSGTDPTTLYEVELVDDGSGNPDEAELTELWPDDDDGDENFNQTDAIATTPSGDEIIFYDKESGHVGIYNVGADTFADEGQASDDPGGVVLAGYSPAGELWAASENTNELYTVDLSGPSINSQGPTGIDLQGADLAFASDGTMYIWTAASADQGLYQVSDPATDTTAVPVDASNIGNVDATVTGMAIRDAGTGDMVVSDRDNDDIAVVDRTTGAIVGRYQMTLDGDDYDYDFGDMTAGELCGKVILRDGTLADDLEQLEVTDGGDYLGLPLDGNLATNFHETEDPADRECFPPGVTHYIGFAWWLPTDVGNEVQGDSVSFDLGFYTEQCRHNGGEGETSTPWP